MIKKKIIISGINLFEGGPLSIIKDCLLAINNSELINNYELVALVHKKELFELEKLNNIQFLEFPKSRKSYFYRLYYEYYYFKIFAKKNDIYFWLSLHDITPTLSGNIEQAVYCHNPSPFYNANLGDLKLQPVFFFFSFFYRFLYKKNINKNKFVIVQQEWLRNEFIDMFGLNKDKIIVSVPEIEVFDIDKIEKKEKLSKTVFSYVTFPRIFKNIELICEAVKVLESNTGLDFEVNITIDGTENSYSRNIVDKYNYLSSINFIGLLSRDEVFEVYSKTDVLIFPSKLETWGLPITEFKQFKKPIFTANLPYAKETIGDYELVKYFEIDDSKGLSSLMDLAIKEEISYQKSDITFKDTYLRVENWNELFDLLLNNSDYA